MRKTRCRLTLGQHFAFHWLLEAGTKLNIANPVALPVAAQIKLSSVQNSVSFL